MTFSQKFTFTQVSPDNISCIFGDSRSVEFVKNKTHILYHDESNNTLYYANNESGNYVSHIVENLDSNTVLSDFKIKVSNDGQINIVYSTNQSKIDDVFGKIPTNFKLIYKNNLKSNFDSTVIIAESETSLTGFDFIVDKNNEINISYLESGSWDVEMFHTLYFSNAFNPPIKVNENLWEMHDIYAEINNDTIFLFAKGENPDNWRQKCVFRWDIVGTESFRTILDSSDIYFQSLKVHKDIYDRSFIAYTKNGDSLYIADNIFNHGLLVKQIRPVTQNNFHSISDISMGVSQKHIILNDIDIYGKRFAYYLNPNYTKDTISIVEGSGLRSISFEIDSLGYLHGVYNKSGKIVEFKSTFKLDPLPPEPGNNIFCEDDSIIFSPNGKNINWYSDSLLISFLYSADSIYMDTMEIMNNLYITQIIKNIESDPIKYNYTINPNPDINLGIDTSLFPGDTLVLKAGIGHENYLWYNNITTSELAVDSSFFESDTLEAFVWVTNTFGCSSVDTIIITLNDTTDLNFIEISDLEIEIFPNPTQDIIYINSNSTNNFTYSIFSITGYLIKQGIINKYKNTIDLRHEVNGIYFLKIYNKNIIRTIKILKSD